MEMASEERNMRRRITVGWGWDGTVAEIIVVTAISLPIILLPFIKEFIFPFDTLLDTFLVFALPVNPPITKVLSFTTERFWKIGDFFHAELISIQELISPAIGGAGGGMESKENSPRLRTYDLSIWSS